MRLAQTPSLIIVMLMALAGPCALACSDADCVTVGDWELGFAIGAGQRSNPLYDGDEIPMLLIPRVRYYGERFFLDSLELGYTVVDRQTVMVNLLATPGYDRMFFSRWDPNNVFVDLSGNMVSPSAGVTSIKLADLEKRRLAVLAGIEFSGGNDRYEWQAQLLNDVSGVHDGQEVRAGFGMAVTTGDWQFSPGIGFTWKSESLVDYYYGIRPEEVSDGLSLYRGKATWNPYAKITVSRQLDERWQLRLHGHYEQLGDGITNSPIVAKDSVVTVFLGADYHF